MVAAVQVHSVRLRRDRICVALEHKVLVYNFADLRLLHSIETLSNPGGILALSAAAEQTILACPGLHVGQVPLPFLPRAPSRGTQLARLHRTDRRALPGEVPYGVQRTMDRVSHITPCPKHWHAQRGKGAELTQPDLGMQKSPQQRPVLTATALQSDRWGGAQVRMELYDVRRTKFIQAHSSGLAALSLSLNGRLLATASDRGTLLRIYSTADGSKLQVK